VYRFSRSPICGIYVILINLSWFSRLNILWGHPKTIDQFGQRKYTIKLIRSKFCNAQLGQIDSRKKKGTPIAFELQVNEMVRFAYNDSTRSTLVILPLSIHIVLLFNDLLIFFLFFSWSERHTWRWLLIWEILSSFTLIICRIRLGVASEHNINIIYTNQYWRRVQIDLNHVCTIDPARFCFLRACRFRATKNKRVDHNLNIYNLFEIIKEKGILWSSLVALSTLYTVFVLRN
jgi:hypothetical protein